MRKNLKELRKRAGFTQQELCEMIGFSRTYYCSIEKGDKRGSLDFYTAIKKVLNLSGEEAWALTEIEQ